VPVEVELVERVKTPVGRPRVALVELELAKIWET
jgi:hypothetical protein